MIAALNALSEKISFDADSIHYYLAIFLRKWLGFFSITNRSPSVSRNTFYSYSLVLLLVGLVCFSTGLWKTFRWRFIHFFDRSFKR